MNKRCIVCKNEKTLDCFYLYDKMKDGHLNKCKECCNNYNKNKLEKYKLTEEYKHRKKRNKILNEEDFKKSRKKVNNNHKKKYPEKQLARNAIKNLKTNGESINRHHWSYNINHYLDFIELNNKDHYYIHKHLFYDNISKMYFRRDNGELLDTRYKHEEYILFLLQSKISK